MSKAAVQGLSSVKGYITFLSFHSDIPYYVDDMYSDKSFFHKIGNDYQTDERG